MANPWNSAAFPKEEHQLLDIMSEELGKRLQIEDYFVWVDMPLTKSDSVLSHSDITTVANIVQSEMECKSFELKKNDKPYDDEESTINQLYVDEGLELYNWKCKCDKKKSVNMVKCTVTPKVTKYTEHSSLKMYSIFRQADLSNNSKQRNKETSLLPSIEFGEPTNALLKMIIDQRYVGKYNHIVGMGKNSVVFNAPHHRHTCISICFINAVKVYRLSNNENENKAVYKRVQREFEHLRIVENKLGNGPTPYRAWDNVILMSFTGSDDKCVAPTIKDVTPTKGMYWAIVRYIDQFYNKLNLVHGKLCAKNIRYYHELRPVFIGWGHSVKRDHPLAPFKLMKDCHYVTKFYKQRGFKVKDTEDLFRQITGCTKISSKLLDVIKKKDLYEKYDENPNRRYTSPIKANGNLRFK